ncbi:MAG: sulfate adenylyltransferase [Candidatus Eremiobacter antarcticus]|nr:sulfate adenylyltransferase [Candidatus Eremiobacteraeota bacterium]MBC5809105.1 sulfate adenylyltransferase [Candidatus Eremiobacteraeota bacterium]PZR61640.1 MAG: sulfate adenylyltransferase [Candidatus Eremiobacter sp. RRmetagenome_bin22]
MNTPYGGSLVNRIAHDPVQQAAIRDRARTLPHLTATARELNDLGLIGNGALSPLTGFMGRADYESVVSDMRLRSGLPWTIPVTLAVAAGVQPKPGSGLAIRDEAGGLWAVVDVEDVYEHDKRREARLVYGTEDELHPGVEAVYQREELLVGGPVTLLPREEHPLSLSPAQVRAEFEARGWNTIVGFQTRNPVHRAHEYIQKCALETVDGLLLHPLVGETKSDDISADVRLRCYRALLDNYYPSDRVMLSTLPAAMRYAGPREAIFHALMRKNFGCTHFIVGRDHAGVGSYYGTYDAQKIFDAFSAAELGIVPLKFENCFYCMRCEGMASRKTCSHDAAHHVSLSGTTVRALLREGKLPPREFSRPEVAEVLLEATAEETRV